MNELSPAEHVWPFGADDATYRMRFSTEQFYQMADAGMFAGCGKVELLDGEVFVSPQYAPHARIQKRLFRALDDAVLSSGRADIEVLFETTIEIGSALAPQPDIVVVKVGAHDKGIPVSEVLLIVEVSVTSLHRDEGVKRAMYATAGVAEYWIASQNSGILHRYAGPIEGRYRTHDFFGLGDAISSITLPDIAAGEGWFPA